MPTEYIRAYCDRAASGNADSGPLRFVASTEGVGRDGLVIKADGWQLDNYQRNPVVLWAHDYAGVRPPIGKTDKVWVDGNKLMADVSFDQSDEFALSIERKYRSGMLNAVSVGWDTLQIEPPANGNGPATVTKSELLDISAVPVPGDPNALKERQKRGYSALVADLNLFLADDDDNEPKHRAAIPPHSTAKADEGASWDGPGQVSKVDAAEAPLRRMMAWVDSEGDPDAKQSYKLPHHNADGDVVWRGVAAAMARLLQAGTQIPDADRRGVYNHLSRHYAQFDKEAPEFRSNAELAAFSPVEIRGLFLEGEPDLYPDLFMERAGAAISQRNRDLLQTAIENIQTVLKMAGTQEDQQSEEERSLHLLHQLFKGVN